LAPNAEKGSLSVSIITGVSAPHTKGGTGNAIELQIVASGNTVLNKQFFGSGEALEQYVGN
jgi:hypothetical protein